MVMTFADQSGLDCWFENPERVRRASKLSEEIGKYSVRKVRSGFGTWMAGLEKSDDNASELPGWKTALLVLLALYPTVMLITILVNPWIAGLGVAGCRLVDNALSVCLLQWTALPVLTATLRRWLKTPYHKAPLLNVGGTIAIVALLASLALVLHRFIG